MHIGTVQRLVRQHQLNVAWTAKETIEAESKNYCAAIEEFHGFCDEQQKNFRRSMIAAMRSFMTRSLRP